MYSIYILRNPKNHLYIGSSSDVAERVHRHNTGQGAEFTKRNKDFKLIYEEKYSTLIEARKREKQIKGWSRAKKEALIASNNELLKILSKSKTRKHQVKFEDL